MAAYDHDINAFSGRFKYQGMHCALTETGVIINTEAAIEIVATVKVDIATH